MNLGDYFPQNIQDDYINRSLKVGAVLKMFVNDTLPPKEKRFIVIGFSNDNLSLASIYINSEINTCINWSDQLKSLQMELWSEGREYLKHRSYVDCSKFIPRNLKEIETVLKNRPDSIIGEVSKNDLQLIMEKIKNASTISKKQKIKYGILKC
jgi:hypothetical protein